MTTRTDPAPVVYRRRVQWGEGDPAHIVYTPRFLDFVMEALEEWWRGVVGVDWYRLNMDLHMGAPVVHVELDFSASVKPGDLLHLTVLVERLGRASVTFVVDARLEDGSDRFRSRVIVSMVDNRRMQAMPVPPEFRERIERYASACARVVPGGAEADSGDVVGVAGSQ